MNMEFRKKAAAATCTAAVASLAFAAPAWSAGDSPGAQACGLYAGPVTQDGNTIHAHGERGPNCADPATVTVTLYKVVPLGADQVIVRQSAEGNVRLDPAGPCAGRGEYYTYTESSTGATEQAPAITLC